MDNRFAGAADLPWFSEKAFKNRLGRLAVTDDDETHFPKVLLRNKARVVCRAARVKFTKPSCRGAAHKNPRVRKRADVPSDRAAA